MSPSTALAIEVLPDRDLASNELWLNSLERSRYRREQAELGRRQTSRRKSASMAISAAMLATPAVPTMVAAKGGPAGSSEPVVDVHRAPAEQPQLKLKQGDSGPAVAAIQRELGITVDGIFGPETRAAIEAFQASAGLDVDGIVGPATWGALFANQDVSFVPVEPSMQTAAIETPEAPTRHAANNRGGAKNDYLVVVREGGAGSSTGAGSTGADPGVPGSAPNGSGSTQNLDLPSGDGGGGGGGGVTACGTSNLQWPTKERSIYGDFGEDRGSHRHSGIDISYGGANGDPVKAAMCGKVETVQTSGQSGGYGNFLCIKHTSAFSTCYAHLSGFKVKRGFVKAGDVIGFIGSTGHSTGPHLHFETRVNGKPQDPKKFLRGANIPGKSKWAKKADKQDKRKDKGDERSTERKGRDGHARDAEAAEASDAKVTRAQVASEPAPAPAPSPEPAPADPAPAQPAPEEPTSESAAPEPAPAPAPEQSAPAEPAPAVDAPEPEPAVEVTDAVAPESSEAELVEEPAVAEAPVAQEAVEVTEEATKEEPAAVDDTVADDQIKADSEDDVDEADTAELPVIEPAPAPAPVV